MVFIEATPQKGFTSVICTSPDYMAICHMRTSFTFLLSAP